MKYWTIGLRNPRTNLCSCCSPISECIWLIGDLTLHLLWQGIPHFLATISKDQLSSISKMIGFRIFYTQLVLMTPKYVNLTEDQFLKLNVRHIRFNIVDCFHSISHLMVKHKQNTSQRDITVLLEKRPTFTLSILFSLESLYVRLFWSVALHCGF